MNEAPSSRRRLSPWALGTWAAAVGYHASLIGHRWIAFDEGTLGQPAWRILRGEVPHRDFDAVYTGLLEYMHAGAMRLIGVHLLTPRLVMLAAIMLWVPALWALARRVTRSSSAASFVTLLAFVSGPPNYPAAMPSWYNLFFATWGLWAMVRWSEQRRPGWLVLAGACAGLSMLFKIAGLFLLAGALFFVLHLDAWRAAGPAVVWKTSSGEPTARPRRSVATFAVVAVAAVLLLVAFETLLIRSQMGLAAWVAYVLATVLLGGLLVWSAVAVKDSLSALRSVAIDWALIGLGVLAAILPFLAWYAVAGGLDDLYRGVFLLPFTRTGAAATSVAPLGPSLVMSLVPTALLVEAVFVRRTLRVVLSIAALALGAWLFIGIGPLRFIAVFTSMELVVPLCTGVGTAVLLRGSSVTPSSLATPPTSRAAESVLLATLWTLALVHLIRYPYAGLIYFTYVAPIAVLAVAGIFRVLADRRVASRDDAVELAGHPVPAAVGAFYAAFFLLVTNRGGMFGPIAPEPEARLALERGRIVGSPGTELEFAL